MGKTSTHRSPYLLLDTCVILEAHRLGVWDLLVRNHSLAVPAAVVAETIQQCREEKFDDIRVCLEEQIRQGLVHEPSLPLSDLRIVTERSGLKFRGAMDTGEQECLACLLHGKYECSGVCSSDRVVFRYLGWIREPERGVSLEEILERMGAPRKLAHKLTKEFRLRWSQRGFQEAFQSGMIHL